MSLTTGVSITSGLPDLPNTSSINTTNSMVQGLMMSSSGDTFTDQPLGFTTASGGDMTTDLVEALMTASRGNTTAGQLYDTRGKEWEPHEYIIAICAPILFCIGVPCNIMSIIVMSGRHYRRTSTGVYLLLLAILDTLYLTVNSINKNFIRLLAGVNLNTLSTPACKIYVYLLFTSKCLGAWFVVAVTVERLVVVCLPHKAKLISTRGRAWIASVLLIMAVCGCFGYIPYVYGLKPKRGKMGCTIFLDNRDLLQMIHKIVDLILYSAIPFFALLIINISLVITVIRSRQQFNAATGPRKDDELRRMTATLIIVSFMFLLCTSPFGLFLALSTYIDGISDIADYDIIFNSLYCVQLTNSTVNFWVYALSAPRFRRELKRIFRCGKPKPKHRNTMSSVETITEMS